jgi:hypothetical protein
MQNKTSNSSNGAEKLSAKSANGNKSKSVKAEAKSKKTAADKNAEKRKALLLASFQAAYENHQKSLKDG